MANKNAHNKGINPAFLAGKTALKRKRPSVDALTTAIIEGDVTALSQGITLVESTNRDHKKDAQALIENCLPKAVPSIRIGITGVPGVGKSTFIEVFGSHLTHLGHKVAVLAVDPSSSVSHGSILGDKTRMESLSVNDRAFIRPSASGDTLGGVARKTREAIILCEAAGYDHIIIETVGVGQSETAVHQMTDFFLLLKLAGAGDELQGIKRGIIEMADTIIINKADGENEQAARMARNAFAKALHLYPPKSSAWLPQVTTCSALENKGITEFYTLITTYKERTTSSGYFAKKRAQQNKYWLLQTIDSALKDNFYNHPEVALLLPKLTKQLEENSLSPFAAAQQLLDSI